MPPNIESRIPDSELRLDSSETVALSATARIAAFLEQNRFLLIFASMSSFMGITVGMAQVTTSLYATKLGCSEQMLGLIAGSQSVGVLVMSLPVGMLVERFGPARLFVIGTLLSGITYALTPLGGLPGYLLACTTAISFFMPLRFVSLNALFLQQLVTLGESKAGWYRGTHMIGTFLIGPTIAARVVGWMGFAEAYWLIAISFGVTILVSRILFSRFGHRSRAQARVGVRELLSQVAFMLRDRELRGLSLLECLNQGVGAFFTFFIIVIAVRVAHLGIGGATGLVFAKGLTYIFSLFALGGVVGKLGRARAYLASLVIMGAGLVALGIASSSGWLWLGSLVLGLGLGTLQIANLTGYARVGQRAGHGKISGMNALAGPAGGILGNLCGGVIGGWLGLQAVFFVFAGLAFLACIPLIRKLRGPTLETKSVGSIG
jgi:MFS family permease